MNEPWKKIQYLSSALAYDSQSLQLHAEQLTMTESRRTAASAPGLLFELLNLSLIESNLLH